MTVPAAATRLTPVSATADARGLAAASTAFVIWGVLALYLKQLQHVPALQITAHRLVWGCLFGMLLLGVRGELTRVHSAFVDPRVRWRLCASAALVSVNWLTYVWAIGNHRVVESSLGYFINPLLNVVLGVVVLSEGLGRVQWTAVAIAGGGGALAHMERRTPALDCRGTRADFRLVRARSQDGSGGCPAGVRRRNAAPPAYDTRPPPTF